MRQARTARAQPATARETTGRQSVGEVGSKPEGIDVGDALARAETFGHRFADLPVQPIQLKGGKGKGKRPQKKAPRRAPEPEAPRDDRNFLRRNLPYVLGGTAPHENRGYFGRILPSFLGGQPVPGGPRAEPEAEVPPVVEEAPAVVAQEDPIEPEPAPAPIKTPKKSAKKRKAPKIVRLPEPEPDPVSEPESDPEPVVPAYEGPKSKKQKNQERLARRRAEQEAERERQAQERIRQRDAALLATRRLPRRVVRHDQDFASRTNSRGQGKAYRVGDDLLPAGNTTVTATEQLHQASVNKGTSNRISFASLRAAGANDYSRGGRDASVRLKFRKFRRARIKGKPDAQGFNALSSAEVLQGIRSNGTQDEQRTARNYANRDGEHQTIGRIPARFLHFDGPPGGYDSDSDDESTDDEA